MRKPSDANLSWLIQAIMNAEPDPEIEPCVYCGRVLYCGFCCEQKKKDERAKHVARLRGRGIRMMTDKITEE